MIRFLKRGIVMMTGSENIATSAEKILQAATTLFAMNNFNAVSIKQIATASGCNSALISYYFGGKKNLYQEVLNSQATVFFKLIEDIVNINLKMVLLLKPEVLRNGYLVLKWSRSHQGHPHPLSLTS